MTGREVLILLALGILILFTLLVVPGYLIRRNMGKVIEIFQEEGAIGIQNAKTVEELGLAPKSLLHSMFGRRDWKPKALDYLIQTDVVLIAEDRKLYITEESLASATWLKMKIKK